MLAFPVSVVICGSYMTVLAKEIWKYAGAGKGKRDLGMLLISYYSASLCFILNLDGIAKPRDAHLQPFYILKTIASIISDNDIVAIFLGVFTC
jgi:hypothetical protein